MSTTPIDRATALAEDWAYKPGSPLCPNGHDMLEALGVPHGIDREREWQAQRYEVAETDRGRG